MIRGRTESWGRWLGGWVRGRIQGGGGGGVVSSQ